MHTHINRPISSCRHSRPRQGLPGDCRNPDAMAGHRDAKPFATINNRTIISLIICLLLAGCATSTKTTRPDSETSTDLEPLLEESHLAYREGRLGDAESLLLKVLEQHPTLAEAWFKLGNVYYRTSRYEAAVRAYEKTVANDKENGRAWYNLALTKIKQADVVLKAGALQLRKDNPYVRRLVGFRSRLNSRFKSTNTEPATTSEVEPQTDAESPRRSSEAKPQTYSESPRGIGEVKPQTYSETPRRSSEAKPQTYSESPRGIGEAKPQTYSETPRRSSEAKPQIYSESPRGIGEAKPKTYSESPRRSSEAKPQTDSESPRRKRSENPLFTSCPSCASW